MTATEKALAVVFKDIGTAFHIIDTKLAPGLPREYSTVKANFFYGKAEEDIEE